jgi:hypothetical protein
MVQCLSSATVGKYMWFESSPMKWVFLLMNAAVLGQIC